MNERSPFYRWGPLAGPVFVVLVVVGFLIGGDSPDPDDPTAKIASYLGKTSSYHDSLVAFFLVLVAALFLLCFFAALRTRLVEAGVSDGAGALALGAGAVSATLFVIALFLFVAPAIAAHDKPGHLLNPDIYRFTQDFGYQIWVASVVVGALVAWATAAVALKTGLLPRWFAWFSVVIGVIALFGIFFFPILIFYAWILVAGIVVYLRPPQPAAAAAADA